eukprot:2391436-Prymnesium_polylepis.3
MHTAVHTHLKGPCGSGEVCGPVLQSLGNESNEGEKEPGRICAEGGVGAGGGVWYSSHKADCSGVEDDVQGGLGRGHGYGRADDAGTAHTGVREQR